MISRVIFIGDPYRGEQSTNIERIKSLFSPVLRQLGLATQAYITEINCNTNRDVWIPDWKNSLASYPSPLTASLDLQGAAVIGFETPEAELNYLSNHNVPWINFCIHPLRFLDDLYFEVTTSFAYDMQNVKASLGLIDFCAETLTRRYVSLSLGPAQKTLLVCGQVWIDRSIYFDGQFRQLKDYLPQLDVLADQYERLLYKPHPAWASAEITELVTNRYQAQLCSNANLYELLVTEGIQTVCAISSSVLTEAPFFGVQPVFLESRAKRYGPAISYRALLDEAEFWEVALLGREKSQSPLKLSPAVPSNHLRRTFSSWGFITDEMHLEGRIAQLEVRASEAESKAQEAESKAQEAESRAQEAESRALESRAQLIALSTSTSWRITKPLRCTVNLLCNLKQLRLHQRAKQLMKLVLLRGVVLIGTHPRMKRAAILLVTRLRLASKLHRLYSAQAVHVFSYSSFPGAQGALEDQSTHVRRIFAQLKVAIDAHQEAHR